MKILYFSLIDWDFIHQRPQCLAERLSSKNDFIYVQPFGLRNLKFSDTYRIVKRFHSFFRRQEAKKGLHIKNLFFIPIMSSSVTRLNSFLLRSQLTSLLTPETIIWVTYPSPLIPGLLEGMKYGALVYEMMDDYSHIHAKSKEEIKRMEGWFVDHADLVITTSEALAEKANKMKKGVQLRMIGNGVDYDFVNNTPKVRPPEFKDMKKIIGYVGTIHDWIDFDLIDYLAENRPDLQFIFVGPVKAKRLPLKKNIHFIGRIDYGKVPAYCNEFDVCLIPFIQGEFADTINPVKLYEYLALGKPVVSYHMRELERYKDIVYLSDDEEDFLTSIEKALNERDNGVRRLRKGVARTNDWTMIAESVNEELLRLVNP